MATEFRLTEDHLKLLRRANVGWDGCEYGAPAIDCKRPYGNGDVAADIAEILGWELDIEGEEGEDEAAMSTRSQANVIHKETAIALQIALTFAGTAVEPGLYRQVKQYDYRSWQRIGD